MPINSAAQNAPDTDPSPPMTTTTNEMINSPSPMFGYTDDSGAFSAPATSASAVPTANTVRCTRRASIPSTSTISGFSAAARMTAPILVRSIQ
jgi:hypothetical protein